MNYLNILKEKTKERIKHLELKKPEELTLKEFAEAELCLLVYSETLKSNLWFCSTENLAKRIKEKNPHQATYTASELKRVIYLRNNKRIIAIINEIKEIFRDSKIIYTNPDYGKEKKYNINTDTNYQRGRNHYIKGENL